MRCPNCGFEDSKVVDSRPAEDGYSIRRRRECLACGFRFTTYERTGDTPLVVIKSDGTSETFNREKLFRGIMIACAKRPITSQQIENLIGSIEVDLRNRNMTQVPSKKLGEMVIEKLLDLDDVAYVRFASVYKDFKSIEEFKDALEDISHVR